MKVILATGIFPPDIGGPATYVNKLANSLLDEGFEVKVITYSSAEEGSYNFPVYRINRKYPWRHLVYLFRLLRISRDCDVIYAQNLTSAGLPSLLVSRILRKRMILKIVGDAAWEQKKPYLKIVQKRVAGGAKTIIVPSYYLKNRVAGWGINADKIVVIYNAVEDVAPVGMSKAEAKKEIGVSGDVILSIGRLAPWKGFKELIASMPDLIKNNDNFKLVIVGEGGDRNNLEKQIKETDLSGNIIMTGSVPHEKIPVYFKAADVFVLDSEYEGLSHVMLESMRLGTPIIASDKGGNPELVEDGYNGLLVEYGNIEQLKQAVLRLWGDESLRNKFVNNSREKMAKFTWENLMEGVLKILKQ